MVDALGALLIVLVLSFILGEFAKFIKLPHVIGHISAGLLLTIPAIHAALFNDTNLAVIEFLANLGIILLFYYVGLEMNITVLQKYARPSVLLSILKTIIPLALGFAVMRYLFNHDPLTSLVVGIVVSTSAQSVSISLLEELGQLRSRIGTLLLSIGVVTDIFELLILSVVLAIFQLVDQSIALILFKIFAFILVIILARLYIIPRTLKLVSKEGNSTSRFMGALILLLAIASIAELFGIGALTGAVVAGLIIGHTILRDVELPNWEEHDIARSIHIIGFGFLIPIFFAWIGLNTHLSFKSAEQSIILLAISIAGILLAAILGGKLTHLRSKDSLALGWGLLAKGDIGFVLSALALELGILKPDLFSAIVIMSISATLISPLMFSYSLRRITASRR